MQKLEKILEEMKESSIMVATSKEHYIHPQDGRFVEEVVLLNDVEEIIRKHMSGKGKDAHMNDGWIPVEERLPEKNEYFVDTSSNKEFPNGYYRRLEIAYMTDTVEYIHGYYDGYKWMDEYLDAIKNVVAWRIHEPYRPERSSDEKE